MEETTEAANDSLFNFEVLSYRSYEKDTHTVMNLNIEMSLDRIELERRAYTFLDVLSDCGGIQAVLISFLSGFLSIINYSHFDSYMASRLFKIKKDDADSVQYKSYFDRSNFFFPPKTGNIKTCYMNEMPKCMVCCKRDRKQKGIHKSI